MLQVQHGPKKSKRKRKKERRKEGKEVRKKEKKKEKKKKEEARIKVEKGGPRKIKENKRGDLCGLITTTCHQNK